MHPLLAKIPFIRRPFYQRDIARQERDLAARERDAAIKERDALMSAAQGIASPRPSKVRHEPKDALPTLESVSTEIAAWYQGKQFAFDWTSPQFSAWIAILAPLRDRPIKMLEIGSYEGRSAIFFLNYLRSSTIVCVDPWDPSTLDPDILKLLPEAAIEFPFAQGRFDRNLAPFGDRVTKIVAKSSDELAKLGVAGEIFDLIYVDGDHKSMAAYRDCLLSWPLLIAGGILIIDDYEFDIGLPEKQPKRGVDAFLRNVEGQYDELLRAYQIIIRRR